MTRYIALDLESTSLDVFRAHPLEIAAIQYDPNNSGGEGAVFAPHITRADRADADEDALAINRYFERRVYKTALDPERTMDAATELHELLTDATIVGANPAYDVAVLSHWFRRLGLYPTPWHHRLYDVECATAAILGTVDIPSLRSCLALWDLRSDFGEPHTAAADARAALAVFEAIVARHKVGAE